MADIVSICNQALLLLGEKVIADLGENSPEALVCNTFYADARDHVLRDIKPHFARKRSANLALSPNSPPEFGFDFAFALPQDSLDVIGIRQDDLGETQFREWRVEGPDILSDRSQMKILYIFGDTNTEALMDSSFVKALAAYLAYEFAYSITNANVKVQTMNQLYIQRRESAWAIYGQESSTQRVINDQITLVR